MNIAWNQANNTLKSILKNTLHEEVLISVYQRMIRRIGNLWMNAVLQQNHGWPYFPIKILVYSVTNIQHWIMCTDREWDYVEK